MPELRKFLFACCWNCLVLSSCAFRSHMGANSQFQSARVQSGLEPSRLISSLKYSTFLHYLGSLSLSVFTVVCCFFEHAALSVVLPSGCEYRMFYYQTDLTLALLRRFPVSKNCPRETMTDPCLFALRFLSSRLNWLPFSLWSLRRNQTMA